MKKKLLLVITSCILTMTTIFGCSAGGNGDSSAADKEIITLVWYPNESGGDLEEARNEIGNIVKEATGKEVEHKLTTDYSIAIESISNGTADLAFMGAQGYVEAHNKNANVVPLVVPSGKSGTIDDAVYYSWLAARKEEASSYKVNGEYSIEGIEGKKMSFVSNSSTSGFKVPTKTIMEQFADKNLTTDDLMEGGKDKFFSEVMYGNSHQGAVVNLLTEKSDISAFCDTILVNYVDLVSGEFNDVGAEYKIKDNAEEPFNTLTGKEFTVISSTPVLNSPFVVNRDVISDEDYNKLVEMFTSEAVTNNQKIFIPKDTEGKGFFTKEAEEKFLSVEDSWFDPIRNMN